MNDRHDITKREPGGRLTIRAGRLTFVPERLPRRRSLNGRTQEELGGGDLYVADLTVIESDPDGPREVLVRFVSVGADPQAARDLITGWAIAVGHGRMWFEDELCDVSDELPVVSSAMVDCPTCGDHFTESQPEFWEMVRRSGHFPARCPTCFSTLPQWDVEMDQVLSGDATDAYAQRSGSR
ncbi:unannotated protein [freshwater metagenome]|uniref:Unannotated protein n=1 Tax=freshwater metagenome TaxID=449393 RepID=A0A6J7CRQ2_9ZZZZ|nr:hypothetical protein [Actinomycetota bacterium]